MRMRPGLISWLTLAALAGGCGGMFTSDEPADHVYWLEAIQLRPDDGSTERLAELVVAVDAVPGLDTDRLLVKGPGPRLNHYAGARWPDHLPEVVGAILRESLESSGRFGRVSGGSRYAGNAALLELELREFFAVSGDTDTAPEIRVELAGYLACTGARTAVRASASATARQNDLTRIVAAFQDAIDDAFTDLGRQVASACFAGVGTQPASR